MNTPEGSVLENLAALEGRIERACARAGRPREAVRLVGASKGQPVSRLEAAFRGGLRRFGENRVQEARAKAPLLPTEIEWHCFGPLQTNKVRQALGIFDFFHAIDRTRIALELDREAARQGRRVLGLIEVNLGGEETKHGFALDRIADALEPLSRLEHLELVGLMAIPPADSDPERARPYFRRLRELAQELNARREWGGRLVELSMGMSEDFEVAIEEGATYVRIGSALFGTRSGVPAVPEEP